jgi:hypothetical protein
MLVGCERGIRIEMENCGIVSGGQLVRAQALTSLCRWEKAKSWLDFPNSQELAAEYNCDGRGKRGLGVEPGWDGRVTGMMG